MYYDLETLMELGAEMGYACTRRSANSIEIAIESDSIFVVMNIPDEQDTFVGFRGTKWHTHGSLVLVTDENGYVELDPLEILDGIRRGEILIVERYLNSELDDRWLAHREEGIDVREIEPGEEIRIRRLSEK